MIKLPDVDSGQPFDWGRTSVDYSAWRPNYPDRFYSLLKTLGVGLPGQRILDLGTGVGFLALRFAQAGAVVTGVDISPGQIEEARRQATLRGVGVDFRVAPAEDTGAPPAAFDVVTASMSWLYFDKDQTIAEVKRVLEPDGLLLTSHLIWLPRLDPVARASEELALRHNPKWSTADLCGNVPLIPEWSEGHFRLQAMFVFDEAIPFTWQSWRGRFRASRAIGASLTPEQVEAFDRDHDVLLRRTAPEHFSVLHRIDAHLFQPVR